MSLKILKIVDECITFGIPSAATLPQASVSEIAGQARNDETNANVIAAKAAIPKERK